jgi:hypothetical protein
MIEADETVMEDRSTHGLVSNKAKTLNFLKVLSEYCCPKFSSRLSFDSTYPEANCRNPTKKEAELLLQHIKNYGLNEQWKFILNNFHQGWFFGLFNYIGDGYRVINRLLTNRCIDEYGINICVGDDLNQAVSDIRDMDILFNQIPETTKDFHVYRCYTTRMPIYPILDGEIVYSSFLSTTLSLRFAQKFCDFDSISGPDVVPDIIYIEIPKGSKVCPIINQKSINHTSEINTEFEVLLDRKGTLIQMNREQEIDIRRKMGIASNFITGFYIYKSPEIRNMDDYIPPIVSGLSKSRRKRKTNKRKQLKKKTKKNI